MLLCMVFLAILILEEGQIVGIDCGAELNGYYGDHAKTFSVGEISEDKRNF